MRYLSIDIEATGLKEKDFIIEFAMIPFDGTSLTFEETLAREYTIKCPSFESLKPKLDPWVIEHNKTLIETAHSKGIAISDFKNLLKTYLDSEPVRKYFLGKKIVLFGKSMNSIDLPFLTRDLGWDFTRNYFHHQVLDLSAVAMSLIDLNMLPPECASGSALMKYLGQGEVAHTALADAKNTAQMYFNLLEKFRK